jgi:hypothetical protein
MVILKAEDEYPITSNTDAYKTPVAFLGHISV